MAKHSKILKTGITALGLGLLLGLGTPAIAQENNKKESLVSKLTYTYYTSFNTKIIENGVYDIKLAINYGSFIKSSDKLQPMIQGVIILTGDKHNPAVETKEIYRYDTDNPTSIYEYNNDVNPKIKEIANIVLAEEAYKHIPQKKPRENKPDVNALIEDLIETLMIKQIEV